MDILNTNFIYVLIGIGSLAFFMFVMGIIFYINELNEKKKIAYKIKEYNEEFYNQTLKDIKNNNTTRTIYEKLDLMLIRSQLKYKYSWNVGLLVGLIVCLFFYGYFSTIDMLGGFIVPIIIAITMSCIPFVCMEFISYHEGKKMKGQILAFIPVLINNSKLSGNDIFRTIKLSANKVNAPLSMYLKDFVNEYENGIPPSVCFENLKYKVPDFRFVRIIRCLENHLYKGGDVVVTLGSISKEYNAREVEEDRRRKQNSSTTMGIYVAVLGNIMILYMMNSILPEVIAVIRQNEWILAAVIINILISLFIGYKATRVRTRDKV